MLKNYTKTNLLRILLVILIGFYLVYYAGMLVYYQTPLFKTPVEVTGIVREGWFTTPVPNTYIETDQGDFYLIDNSPQITQLAGKKVFIRGLLTRNELEIIVEQDRHLNAKFIEVKEITEK